MGATNEGKILSTCFISYHNYGFDPLDPLPNKGVTEHLKGCLLAVIHIIIDYLNSLKAEMAHTIISISRHTS